MKDAETVRRFHDRTRNLTRPAQRPPGLRPFRRMDPRNAPAPFKRYPGALLRGLPTDLSAGVAPALEVLAGRLDPGAGAGVGRAAAVDLGMLARLLFYSGGVTRTAGREPDRLYFRAAASAGNLHPLETYLVSGDVPGLAAGVYHFAPDAFSLETLREGDHRGLVAGALAEPVAERAPATLLVTGIPWRTAWKYAERGWRHIFWDAGTMLANLLAVAEAHGVRVRLWFGFRDAEVRRLLDLDGTTEFPLVAVTLAGRTGKAGAGDAGRGDAGAGDTGAGDTGAGDTDPGRTAPPGPATIDPRDRPTPPLRPATMLSPAPIELPLITAAHHAGDLHDAAQVRAWRDARPGSTRTPSTPTAPAVSGRPSGEPIETVILRRGSTRRMRRTAVPPDLLTWAMACATRAVPSDVLPPDATLLTHFVSVHAVDATPPGRYRYDTGASGPEALRPVDRTTGAAARDLAAHLCLDQDLGGDSAYTVFAVTDLDRTLGTLGARGYRVSQTEAGIVAGRLQLAAFALGYGATGLTFYDEEVAAAFGTRSACMLVCAVGVPAYRSRPGTTPG